MFAKAKIIVKSLGQKLEAVKSAPSSSQIQLGLFALGITLLTTGLISESSAQGYQPVGEYNDSRFAEAVDLVMSYLQGSFGALVMVAAGIGAILSSAFGQYRAALGLLVVAVGAFILRSLVSTFFNDVNLMVNNVTE